MPRKQEIKIDETPITNETTVQPNETVTSEQFTNSSMLDMIAVNNELNTLNQGELTFKVTKRDNYVFDKEDKDGNKIPQTNQDGSPIFDEEGNILNEQIITPYVEVQAMGLSLTFSTKHIDKLTLSTLEANQVYVGTYALSTNDKGFILPKFHSVVHINQELESRVKARGLGV